MLFNSLEFAIFFPVVVALYFLIPQRARTLLFLLADGAAQFSADLAGRLVASSLISR